MFAVKFAWGPFSKMIYVITRSAMAMRAQRKRIGFGRRSERSLGQFPDTMPVGLEISGIRLLAPQK